MRANPLLFADWTAFRLGSAQEGAVCLQLGQGNGAAAAAHRCLGDQGPEARKAAPGAGGSGAGQWRWWRHVWGEGQGGSGACCREVQVGA